MVFYVWNSFDVVKSTIVNVPKTDIMAQHIQTIWSVIRSNIAIEKFWYKIELNTKIHIIR